MRIMEICSGVNVNGAIITCLETIKALVERGHDITLVCRPNAWIGDQFGPDEIDVVYSDLSRWPATELKRVAGIVREKQIDVVHTHMSRAHFFGVLLRHLFKVPCVATANNRYLQLHWMFNDRVIAASIANKKYHSRVNLVPKKRIDVVHNFVHYEDYGCVSEAERIDARAAFGIDASSIVIGQVGKVLARKGLIYTVKALPDVLSVAPDTKLLVAGACDEPSYEAKVRSESAELDVEHAIVWAGHCANMHHVLAAMDILVLPSLEDSLPLAILEAMASRIPVVASTVGGIPECVFDGKTGYLTRPGNVEDICCALKKLANDGRLRDRMGQAARKRIIEEFSPESQVPLVEETFRLAAA